MGASDDVKASTMKTAHTDIPRTIDDFTSAVCAEIISRVLVDGPVELPLKADSDVPGARSRIHAAALQQIEPISLETLYSLDGGRMLVVRRFTL